MRYLLLLIILIISSCNKEEYIPIHKPIQPQFNEDIKNSIWTLQEIEFQNQVSYYKDTLKFLPDTTLIYNGDTSGYEFYKIGLDLFELRLGSSPVGYIDTQISSQDIMIGKLNKQVFYNVYIISNKYYITLNRLK
jgi:hypothetical protein